MARSASSLLTTRSRSVNAVSQHLCRILQIGCIENCAPQRSAGGIVTLRYGSGQNLPNPTVSSFVVFVGGQRVNVVGFTQVNSGSPPVYDLEVESPGVASLPSESGSTFPGPEAFPSVQPQPLDPI
eukprot:2368891-Rhodomonas_salina.5